MTPQAFYRVLTETIMRTFSNDTMTLLDEIRTNGQLLLPLNPPSNSSRRTRLPEMEDGHTGFLIERALDEARSRQFRPTT
jgi:hypothetical protein